MRHAFVLSAVLLASSPVWATSLNFEGLACAAGPDGAGPLLPCADGLSANQDYGDSSQMDVSFGNNMVLGGTYVPTGTYGRKFWDSSTLFQAIGTDTLFVGSIVVNSVGGSTVSLTGLQFAASTTSRFASVVVRDLATYSVLFHTGLTNIAAGTALSMSPSVLNSQGFLIEYFDTTQSAGLDNIILGAVGGATGGTGGSGGSGGTGGTGGTGATGGTGGSGGSTLVGTPEPSSIALIASALATLGLTRRGLIRQR